MLESGVHGVFLFGSSGEGPHLQESDRIAGLEVARETIASQIPILAGVLEPATDRVISAARTAQSLGADGVVVCPPYYFPATQEHVLSHFRAIREAIDLPIIAYDIPVTTKVKINLDTMLTLAREGTIIGVKDSSGDSVGFRRLLMKRPSQFAMFTGAELLVDQVLLAGAEGAVPGLANVAAKPFVELYNFWRAGESKQAVELQNTMANLFDVFIPPTGERNTGYAVGAMKVALKIRRIISSATTSLPFAQVTTEQEERTRSIMLECGVL